MTAATGGYAADPGARVDATDAVTDYKPGPACPTRTPEVHELGEFPMTCYRCHVEADS